MVQTFVTRINNDKEYNRKGKTMLWNAKKGEKVYDNLKLKDNILLLGSKGGAIDGKVLVGSVSNIEGKKNFVFSNIEELACTNEELLKVGSFFPEFASQLKASTKSFIHKKELNINNIKKEISEKKYIDFYVFQNDSKFKEHIKNIKEYDRIVILDKNNSFNNVRIQTINGLKSFDDVTNYNALGLSLQELLKAHKIAKTGGKGNNIKAVNRLIDGINDSGFYKFRSFTEYYNTLFNNLTFKKDKVIKYIESLNIKKDNTTKLNNMGKENGSENKTPLNQILYGPPGTGKTYHTVNKALNIIGEKTEGIIRKDLKKIFDSKVKGDQIVFTTFHQSMSYEDFIEGIKPLKPKKEDKFIEYDIKPGILKKFCDHIKSSNALESQNYIINTSTTFDELFKLFINKISEIYKNLNENENYYFTSRRANIRLVKVEEDTIVTQGENATNIVTITKDKMKVIYEKYKNVEDIINIYRDLRELEASISWTTNYFAVFKALKDFEESIKNAKQNKEQAYSKKYVLIIDEINRGNVSQIFGELITLIEKDKRLGNNETLEITLPYSKEPFGVPPNLYIIGTMNTADRSVEALDTALRRRFSFEEMLPDPNLIKEFGISKGLIGGIDLVKLLTIINNRIEILLDKDHLIGHSYFLDAKDIKDLKLVFKDNIIPLLQEYFYGDYFKIALVLGKGFVKIKEQDNTYNFAKVDFQDERDLSEYDGRKIFEIVRFENDENDEKFKNAITELMINESKEEKSE